jgi:1-acyl-sn-glycerol-3-phosphate acyltransferase
LRIVYRIIAFIVNLFSKIIGNLKIINPERLKDIEGCIIAPNHIKAGDAPFIMSIFQKEVYLIAKKELFDIPFLNILIKYVGAISVRRGQVDREAIIQAKAVLEKGHILIVFPEGSRKSYTAKPGVGKIAFESQSDIVPVFIKYPKSWIKSIIRKDCMEIVIGEKIMISEYEISDNHKDTYRFIAKDILQKIMMLEKSVRIY